MEDDVDGVVRKDGAQAEDLEDGKREQEGDRGPVAVVRDEDIERVAGLHVIEELEDVGREPLIPIQVEERRQSQHQRQVVDGRGRIHQQLPQERRPPVGPTAGQGRRDGAGGARALGAGALHLVPVLLSGEVPACLRYTAASLL